MERQSKILCNVLDMIWVTDRARKWYKDTASGFDDMFNLARLPQGNFKVKTVGSLSDGSFLMSYKSDVDILLKIPNMKILDLFPTTDENYSWIENINDKPGYVYLCTDKEPLNKRFQAKNCSSGKMLLEHTILHEEHFIERHGPAHKIAGFPILLEMDFVYCLDCPWPKEANEWINRQRHHNYPSKETKDLLLSLPCLVVQAGHPETPDTEKSFEWRLSFTLQEDHLICNLNDTQYKCYVLLKMVKKDLIILQQGQSLTSYHCKTALFYTIEQNKATIWRPDNLIQCIVLCLKNLQYWTRINFCPNYFMPTVDLFLGKIDKLNMSNINNVLTRIITNPIENIKHITISNVGKMFSMELSEVRHENEMKALRSDAKEEIIDTVAIICLTLNYYFIHRINLQRRTFRNTSITLRDLLQGIQDKLISTPENHQLLVKQLIPCLYANLASKLISKSMKSNNQLTKIWLFSAAALNFHYATESADNIYVYLKLANVLFASGYIKSAKQLLDKIGYIIEANISSSMTQEDAKAMPMLMRLERVLRDMDSALSIPVYTLLNRFPHLLLRFDETEIEVVPKCFVFELIRNIGTAFSYMGKYSPKDVDFGFMVDPVMFYNYLTFLVKDDNTIFSKVVKYDRLPYYTLILLGWVAKEKGDNLDAALSFFMLWDYHEELWKLTHSKAKLTPHYHSGILWFLVLMYEIWKENLVMMSYKTLPELIDGSEQN